MKAIGYRIPQPIDSAEALESFDLAQPRPGPHDVLVRVAAVAVNPVDSKIRRNVTPEDGGPRILGWDAAGDVVAVGEQVTLFQPGDRVWYAGDLNRPGSNAEYQRVDERLVGRMPETLTYAEAAAMPLTTITAWELLFDRLGLARRAAGSERALTADSPCLLVVGAGGGVGSILVQLARQLTGARVIATASRAETRDWLLTLGADHVINHHDDLADQLAGLGLDNVSHVASLNGTEQHLAALVEVLRPQGRFGLIDDPQTLDVMALKRKSISLHWEFMFTRSMFATDDRIEQHRLLTEVASLVDQGILRTTLGQHLGGLSVANLRRAHELQESGQVRGKLVLDGF